MVPGPAEHFCAALVHAAAVKHNFLAWQHSQAEDYYYTLLGGAPPRLEGLLPMYHPQLSLGAPPGLEGTSPATADKAVQTDIVSVSCGPLANCGKIDVDEPTMTEVEVRTSIRELKEHKADVVAKAFPTLREQLGDPDPIVTAKILFDFLMDGPVTPRAPVLDLIVLCVAEQCGCSCRHAFEEGLFEISAGRLDEQWRSRLHNAVYKNIRVNNIPCFSRKTRHNPNKRAAVASATACGEMSSVIGSIELASGVSRLGSAVPATLLWLGPEC